MIKGLEALEEISLLVDVRKEYINKYLNIIEKELKEKEEIADALSRMSYQCGSLLRYKAALKIIKEKMVDARALIEILEDEWTWEQYMDEEDDRNTGGHQFSRDRLTQNEFDLLREVLKDE